MLKFEKSPNKTPKLPRFLSPESEIKPPRLVDYGGDVSKKWYVECYFYDKLSKKLSRKRFYNINKPKDKKSRRIAANLLLIELTELQQSGFKLNDDDFDKIDTSPLSETDLKEAFGFYLKDREKQLKPSTYRNVKTAIKNFVEFTTTRYGDLITLGELDNKHALRYYDYLGERFDESKNKHVNNQIGYIKAFFNFYVKREVIVKNPFSRIDKRLLNIGAKHTPFSDSQVELLKKEIELTGDRQFYLFVNFLYYTLARPGSEVRLLKIGDIKEKTIIIESGNAKNRRSAPITISHKFNELINEFKLRDYPSDYYVFSSENRPGLVEVGINHFYKRHKQILKKLGMFGLNYDMYGWKHTAVIHLFQKAGLNIRDIQQQCRHSSIQQTEIYLRSLGLITNNNIETNNLSLF